LNRRDVHQTRSFIHAAVPAAEGAVRPTDSLLQRGLQIGVVFTSTRKTAPSLFWRTTIDRSLRQI
jgi:hypothetical protein